MDQASGDKSDIINLGFPMMIRIATHIAHDTQRKGADGIIDPSGNPGRIETTARYVKRLLNRL